MNLKIWFRALGLAFFLAIFVRNFIFEPFYYENKLVWIDKFTFGGRFPITPIALPLVKSKIPFSTANSYLSSFQIPYFRFFSLSQIEHFDFLAFNSVEQNDIPIDRKQIQLAKCLAIAGDSVRIDVNKLTIKNTKDTFIVKNHWVRVWLQNLASEITEKYNLEPQNLANYIGAFSVNTNSFLFSDIQQDTLLKKHKINSETLNILASFSCKQFSENIFFVPKKNEKITINSRNFSYIKPLILYYEQNKVEIKNGKLFINDIQTNEYKFKYNYFLVLLETNKLILIPENHIIGVVF